MMSWCMVPEDVIQQFQAIEPPTDFPVFVNTDIESSSALWGALGSVMHDAQDIHDNLLRTLLVPHHGYEITTAGDSFQLAFHNIADAVAYCLDVQQKLLQQEWPQAFVDCHMPGSATITTHQSLLKRPKMVFHGVRVRMGIHASNPAEGDLVNQVHPVTGRMMYVGLSELIGREVSDIGCGGQIIITAPIVRWLRINLAQRTEWAKAHPCFYLDMGVHHIEDLRIDLGIAQLVPMDLMERVGMFPPLRSRGRLDTSRTAENHYSLLISPVPHHDDPSYAFPAWTLLYVVVMALSLAASFTAALALHKYSKLVSSCICYAMLHFFTWKSIYSLFRITVLAVLMEQFNHKESTWFILDRDHDIGGFRLVGHENADHLGDVGPPPFYVKMALFIGDISLLSGSFWMFVLVAEL
ncbi:hypothetical protein DYB28_012411, partial [Aphanomyces astaci]